MTNESQKFNQDRLLRRQAFPFVYEVAFVSFCFFSSVGGASFASLASSRLGSLGGALFMELRQKGGDVEPDFRFINSLKVKWIGPLK